MKKNKKILITLAALAVMCCGIVMPTFSWLSASSERVVNTFAGGAISIILDEAKVDGNGNKTDEPRVTENSYKFAAGAVLYKDPTVTVLQGSEECYVFLYVENPLPDSLFSFNYSGKWLKIGENGNSSLYVYDHAVNASSGDIVLEPIFTQISISESLTSQDIQALGEQKVIVQAYAVQCAQIQQQEAFELAGSYFAGQFGISGFGAVDETVVVEGEVGGNVDAGQVHNPETDNQSESTVGIDTEKDDRGNASGLSANENTDKPDIGTEDADKPDIGTENIDKSSVGTENTDKTETGSESTATDQTTAQPDTDPDRENIGKSDTGLQDKKPNGDAAE